MDRKIEVGDEYDFRGTVVAVQGDGWVQVSVGRDADPVSVFVPPSVIAHSTLVKAAERAEPPPPLKVGDMVRLPGWTRATEPRPIVFIDGRRNEAVVDLGKAGLSRAYKLSSLRRAEPA